MMLRIVESEVPNAGDGVHLVALIEKGIVNDLFLTRNGMQPFYLQTRKEETPSSSSSGSRPRCRFQRIPNHQ